tara:strand:+ start:371 stop:802 length:432 start_codon:yes stop_codon:yes gene_type:complete
MNLQRDWFSSDTYKAALQKASDEAITPELEIKLKALDEKYSEGTNMRDEVKDAAVELCAEMDIPRCVDSSRGYRDYSAGLIHDIRAHVTQRFQWSDNPAAEKGRQFQAFVNELPVLCVAGEAAEDGVALVASLSAKLDAIINS